MPPDSIYSVDCNMPEWAPPSIHSIHHVHARPSNSDKGGVVEDIKATRESILDVARALTKIDESDFELEENQPKTGDIIGKEG